MILQRSPLLVCVAAAFAVGGCGLRGSDADRVALEALYDATAGESWTENTFWKNSAVPLGLWHGVTTDVFTGRVTELDLKGNDLTGPDPDAPPIPEDLRGALAYLEYLDLSENNLTGPIPVALGNLANLQHMDISYNWGLSGPLPDGLRFATSLANRDGKLLNIFVTQACAPAAWRDWLATISFRGRLCDAEAETETGSATIHVAVFYTKAALDAVPGGEMGINAEIDEMITEANNAYEMSGVRHRVELVHRAQVDYEEGVEGRDGYEKSDADVRRLEDPNDGHMDDVHKIRDNEGADLVHLIVDDVYEIEVELNDQVFKTSIGGIAVSGGAFGLTALNSDYILSFVHELGHNMGLMHDRYQELCGEGETCRNGAGLRPHPAYGYINQPALLPGGDENRRWHTIMAYNFQCARFDIECPPLSSPFRFSNPRKFYMGDRLGVPFGAPLIERRRTPQSGLEVTGPADAVAVLNTTMPAVALWRDPPAGANQPPAVSSALPDQALSLPGDLTVDVSEAFVDPDGDPLTWAASVSRPGVVAVARSGARVFLTAVGPGTATITVTATDPGGLSATQTFTVTVSSSFTDSIRAGATRIRAVHFTELRTRIDRLREAAGLEPFRWTDSVLRAGVTRVRLVHVRELREALGDAYRAAGRTPPSWTDAWSAAETTPTPIRAVHLTELRAAVMALE